MSANRQSDGYGRRQQSNSPKPPPWKPTSVHFPPEPLGRSFPSEVQDTADSSVADRPYSPPRGSPPPSRLTAPSHPPERQDSAGIRLAPEVARAATALRSEGKELSNVLMNLRQRCGNRILRAPAGHEAVIRIALRGPPDRTAIFRLATAAGLKHAEVLPASDGVRVCYLEEYPPSATDPELPTKLHAHAAALADALTGHHQRAVAFFGLLAEHHLGPDVRCTVERHEPHPSDAGRSGGASAVSYPHVPALEMAGAAPLYQA